MRAFGRFVISALLLAGGALPAFAAVPTLLLDVWDSGVAPPYDTGIEGRFLSLGEMALVPVRETSSGHELWVTDGTDVGTHHLRDFCLGPCSSDFDLLGTIGGVGVFLVYPNGISQDPSLWRSDGTRSGTFVVAGPGQAPGRCALSTMAESVVVGGNLLFSGRTGAGCDLWKTDGTVEGTVRLKEITPADLGSHVLHEMTKAGGRVFFVAPDFDGWGLWTSNGTAAGTVRLRSFSGEPSTLVAVGSRLFFAAPAEGLELWTSDGTVAGTRPVTRFAPADPFVFHNELAFDKRFVFQEVDGQLYFLANDGVTGREIWRSDGTAAGTRPVTSMVNASPFIGLPAWRIEKLDGHLLFKANDGLTGPRLWTTNGQPASTAPLGGCAGGCPVLDPETALVRVGARLFFAASPDGTRSGLWVTDGTGAGTRKLRDFCEECGPERMVSLLGRLFFAAGISPFDWSLWVSDGTAAGTRLVRDLLASRSEDVLPFPPVALGTRGLLAVADPISGLAQLWRTDGTPEGSAPVTSIGSNGLTSSPHSLVPAGSVVRFLANDENGQAVWTSSGTAAATQRLEPAFFAEELAPLGSWTLLVNRLGPLGRTDGTAAGTIQLTPDDLVVLEVASLGNRAVFSANDFENGRSLWATDGTIAGTQKILSEGAASLLPAGSEVFFLGPSASVGRIWSTDGTAAGTRPVTPDGVQVATPLRVARLGSKVFFSAYTSNLGPRLWRSDGTAAGTSPVLPDHVGVPGELTVHQGQLYFVAATASESLAGLWRSDGTDAGTVLLRTFERANTFADLPAAYLTPVGSLLYFVAGGESGRELWRTDGTPAGTVLVRDIAPGEESSYPSDLEALNGRLYFTANDGEHGMELWESDGTTAGTHLLRDIAPGAFSSDPRELTAAGGRLYFTADDKVHGREPWVYAPEVAGCEPSEFVLCLGNGRFRVEADWRDFEGGNGRGRAVALTADTGYFWFFEPSNVEVILKVLDGQGLNGHHWVFYGALSSVEYTLTVTDTQTGAARRYINPSGLLGSVADTQAFGPQGASAPAGTVAGEPRMGMRQAVAEGSCAPSATRLCLNDGRFAVEARWKDFQGNTGTGKAVPLPGGDTGYFWFFDEDNVEVVLKVLDGRPLNAKFWVFYGALSSVEYTLTVTDTVTGTVKTYTNPSGKLASVADTGAF